MPRVYLADKDTLDNVNDKVGTSSDTASSSPTTLFAGIKSLISTLATHVANWTATRAAKIDKLDNLGATGDTGGSATAGTLMAKLNALLTSWTSTRAGYLDKLNNATYGLEAIKNAINGLGGLSIKSHSATITCTAQATTLNLPEEVKIGLLAAKCNSSGGTVNGYSIPAFTQYNRATNASSNEGANTLLYTQPGASGTKDIQYYMNTNRITCGNSSGATNITLVLTFYYLK